MLSRFNDVAALTKKLAAFALACTASMMPASAALAGEQLRFSEDREELKAQTAMAGSPTGNSVVVWRQGLSGNMHIYARGLAGDGAFLSLSEILVSDPGIDVPGGPDLLDVGMNDGGQFFVVVWQRDVEDITLRMFNADGSTFNPPFNVTDGVGQAMQPRVAMDGLGRSLAVWRDQFGDGIYGRVYDLGGPVTAAFPISGEVVPSGRIDGPSVDVDDNGNFVVTWVSCPGPTPVGCTITARRYTSGGTLGSLFTVYTSSGDTLYSDTDVASDADGDFAVAWSMGPSGESDVYVRRMTRNGVAIGSAVRANSYTPDTQGWERIASDADGNFIVTWTSRNQRDAYKLVLPFTVHARAFDSGGNPLGTDFFLRTQFTRAYAFDSSVIADADGNFLAAWSSVDVNRSEVSVRYSSFPGAVASCPPAPGVCRGPSRFEGANVELRKGATDPKDLLDWNLRDGTSTTKAEFKDPTTAWSYALCIYDGNGLRSTTAISNASFCDSGTGLCWKETAKGFQYKDRDATRGGMFSIVLKEGLAGDTDIHVQGRGANIDMPDLGALVSPVRVQFRRDGLCWDATYSFPPAIRNTSTWFKDRSN